MSSIFTKTALLSSILAASATTSMAHAEQPVAGFTLTPSLGYSVPDNNRDLEDDRAVGLSLGYQFDNPWAIEFTYLNLDSELESGQDIDADQYRLDGLYHFANDSAFTPYVAAGLGTTEYSNNLHGDGHTQLNAGGGVKYALQDNVALRLDYRLLDDLEGDHIDQVATLGLQYTFGHKKAEPIVVAEPEPVVVAEPEPVEPEPVEIAPAQTVLPYDIYFAFDSAAVSQDSYAALEHIANHLANNPEQVAQIQGYADDTGAADYNLKLSEKRAQAVVSKLVDVFSVDPSRLNIVGYGEEKPVVPNNSAENRQLNRRATTVAFRDQDTLDMSMSH